MGSSMSAIYDDYRHYEELCKNACIDPLPMRDSCDLGIHKWYAHYEELLALKAES